MARIISQIKPLSGYFSTRCFPFFNQLHDIADIPQALLKAASHGWDMRTVLPR